ncbi:MAG: cytochrome C [Planctomycetes bacterium]|nr:cytochrome C [Planctomycetota bacterium]
MTAAVGYYLWYGFREGVRHDRLITQLEADPALAKTHHRKPYPFHPAWDKVVHTWPYLLRVEFLAALIVTVGLILWAIWLPAPLEPPANPTLTTNPAKAPWYFLGLQELLVYFDPWIAGVILPHLVLGGLMAIPYIDVNPLGNGYYTWRQRKFAISTYMFGFLVLWVLLAIVGTFIRGPGWMWFWPGMTWDAHRQVHEVNRHLHELFGLTDPWVVGIFGGLVTLGGIGVGMAVCDVIFRKFKPKTFLRQNLVQYLITLHLIVLMAAVPLKIVLKLVFNIKYIWVTPWFNV